MIRRPPCSTPPAPLFPYATLFRSFRTQKQLDASASDIAVLRDYGVPYELPDRDCCVGAEPGLAATRDRFLGGLRMPHDETGDCHLFTNKLDALLPPKDRKSTRLQSNPQCAHRISSSA